jgi:hypothetical protein
MKISKATQQNNELLISILKHCCNFWTEARGQKQRILLPGPKERPPEYEDMMVTIM